MSRFGITFRAAGLLAATVMCIVTSVRADEPADADRRKRLEALKAKIAEYELFPGDNDKKAFKRTDEPILRYTDPIRDFLNDGATFLWLDGERPAAVGSISIRNQGRMFYEFTSLSSGPMKCVKAEQPVWLPKSGGLVGQRLADAPAPQATAVGRLTQMRSLARRFSATIYKFVKPDDPVELRLLPQPIYRFSDDKAGVIDGGLFSLAEATDPEALLLLEAVREKAGADPVWKFTLARMTTARLIMKFDDQEVFHAASFFKAPRNPDDPYVEAADGTFSAEKTGP